MSLTDFEIIKELGKGAFGTVCKVRRKLDNNIYAMKRVKITQLNNKERENALNEVRILASLQHENIIGYKQAFFDEDSRTLNIVMEFAEDGDLESKIQSHKKNNTNFPENLIWSFLIQMVLGLKALHDNKIMHRDLKCANIFLMKDGTLKLGDLNVSKVVKMQLAYTQTGTPYYASPEVWSDKPYDYKSDLWSVGAVIYELCALKPPFRGADLKELFKNIMKGVYDPIPKIYSKDLANMIASILQVNPSYRPNCDQILKNQNIIKRTDFWKNTEKAQINLIGTIKNPRNLSEINKLLPKDHFEQNRPTAEKKKIAESEVKSQEDVGIFQQNKVNNLNNIEKKQENLNSAQSNKVLIRPDSAKIIPKTNIIRDQQFNNDINQIKKPEIDFIKYNIIPPKNYIPNAKPSNIVIQNNIYSDKINEIRTNDKGINNSAQDKEKIRIRPISSKPEISQNYNQKINIRPDSALPSNINVNQRQNLISGINNNYSNHNPSNILGANPSNINYLNIRPKEPIQQRYEINKSDAKPYKYESPYNNNNLNQPTNVVKNINTPSISNVKRPVSSSKNNYQPYINSNNYNAIDNSKKPYIDQRIGNQNKNIYQSKNYGYNQINVPKNNYVQPISIPLSNNLKPEPLIRNPNNYGIKLKKY